MRSKGDEFTTQWSVLAFLYDVNEKSIRTGIHDLNNQLETGKHNHKITAILKWLTGTILSFIIFNYIYNGVSGSPIGLFIFDTIISIFIVITFRFVFKNDLSKKFRILEDARRNSIKLLMKGDKHEATDAIENLYYRWRGRLVAWPRMSPLLLMAFCSDSLYSYLFIGAISLNVTAIFIMNSKLLTQEQVLYFVALTVITGALSAAHVLRMRTAALKVINHGQCVRCGYQLRQILDKKDRNSAPLLIDHCSECGLQYPLLPPLEIRQRIAK